MNDLSVMIFDINIRRFTKLFLQYIDLENDIDITDNISKVMNRMTFEVFIST